MCNKPLGEEKKFSGATGKGRRQKKGGAVVRREDGLSAHRRCQRRLERIGKSSGRGA